AGAASEMAQSPDSRQTTEAPPDAAAQPSRTVEAPPPVERVGRLDFAPVPKEEIPTEAAFKKGLVVGPAEAEIIPDLIGRLPSLSAVAEKVQECRRCPLYATATNGVPGEGDPHAGLVCVGEAPGANEDATGRPFVGQAGQLLTKILAAIDLKREEVFIVNVLKHRPPGNRNPRPEEVEACSPYLIRQLELIKPKVIVAFGTFAAQTLLQTKTPLGQLRGLVHRYHGTPLVVTYHPAALLRNPAWKRPTWEDVKLARRVLDSATGS
ncbi:MAG TPA: uracil-DNA glycosylase, partial [Gemmatimonadaceae bacterium]|nr:uracil-DNA glycosylase [Gemmatimonadaceae bacterium]